MAEFNINDFKAKLGLGGSRPNQFKIIIAGPPNGQVDNSFLPNVSPFLVTSASLPGQTIGTASVFYRGREVKLAGDRTYTAWATTIINDRNLKTRAELEKWMNSMDHLTEKNGFTDPRSYTSTLFVQQLDRNGEIIHTYVLNGAWPSDISDVGLGFDLNDTISTFTCTWNYQDFTISTFDGDIIGEPSVVVTE